MIHLKKIFSVMLAFALIFSFATQSLAAGKITTEIKDDGRVQVIMEFKDSEEAEWAFEYIAKMQAKKVFSGYEDGTFRPNQPVNRVEAIVTAVRLMGLEEEAKAAQLEDVELHFKDAKLIDKRYAWAKGYVVVALENGLFDASEEKIQPDKPASRIWVSSLLVRALGLEEEALTMMTDVPEFKDAAEIPAGAIGYVNVALEKELITGYPDQTFKPNKNVTRAEMATLLNRTNDGLLEENGAVTVMGTITNIELNEEELTEEETGTEEEIATEEEVVVEQTIGSITVETYNGLSQTYEIASDIYVEFEESFLTFDQLKVGDKVSLVVNEEVIVEAALITEEVSVEEIGGIIEFKLEVELDEDEEFEYKYENEDGEIKAKIEKKTDDSKLEIKGEEAQAQIEDLLKELELASDISKEEAVSLILEVLEVDQADIKEFELEVKFADGTKLKIELEQDDDDHDDEEDED